MSDQQSKSDGFKMNRRTLLKTGLALGATQVISAPFIIKARGEVPIKIGMVDPLTGAYAALAKNEVIGAHLAVDHVNAHGGIMGRKVELLVEDSANDVGTGVQKARKLIDRDKVSFLIGDVNSAIALALGQVSSEKGVLHVVSGGHTDAVTGKQCHWNVFRVCNTTFMETASVGKTLINKYGKKWYFITPDYAFGHTLQSGFEYQLKKYGGTEVGADLTPLGTSDFSAYLIKAQAAKPDVLIVLTAGQDAVNTLKQAVQFGLDKQMHIAGAQQELENLEALPPEARIGTWVFEWYWKQKNNHHVAKFVSEIRKRTGKVPTARTWFGYTSAYTFALIANQEKTLNAVKLAKALQGYHLPSDVALQPGKPFYRAGDHQLMPTLFVGHAKKHGGDDREDLFDVTQLVDGSKAALPASETGCVLKWPA
ncbi:MAG TPA: ABC transporter substrate-binding protein [bacterium]|nr:ABC transporter substrate-binding protein [bacterium]